MTEGDAPGGETAEAELARLRIENATLHHRIAGLEGTEAALRAMLEAAREVRSPARRRDGALRLDQPVAGCA